MSNTIIAGWLKDHEGNKLAPKTLFSQVQANDGTTLEEALKNTGTQPDWNQNDSTAPDYIKNKPFYEEGTPGGPVTLTFDGDLTGREYVEVPIDAETSGYYVKLSDQYHEASTFMNSTLTVSMGGNEQSVVLTEEIFNDEVTDFALIGLPGNGFLISEFILVTENNVDVSTPSGSTVTVTSGIWCMYAPAYNAYAKSLSYEAPGTGVLVQLDEKFIPDTIARADHNHSWNDLSDRPFYEEGTPGGPVTLTFDGDLTGKEYVEVPISGDMTVYYVRLSDQYAEPTAFITSRLVSIQGGTEQTVEITEETFNDSITELSNEANGMVYMVAQTVLVVEDVYTTSANGGMTLPKGIWGAYVETAATYTKSVTYTVPSNLTVIQLDEKFIPDTIARKSDLGNVSDLTVSWNDLTDKPFYEDISIDTLCEVTGVDASSDEFTISEWIGLVVENTYTVNWNGSEYECVAWIGNNNTVCLGNEDTPFWIQQIPEEYVSILGYGIIVIVYDGSSEVTMSIVGKRGTLVKIDEKFLPDHNLGNGVAGGSLRNVGATDESDEYSLGFYATAIGADTKAPGVAAFAEGSATTASGIASHAENSATVASGEYSHAEGAGSVASGDNSHAEGQGTIAYRKNQHVQGMFNAVDENNYSLLHIVGNGSSDTERSNAHTLDRYGNAWYAGTIKIGGTSYEDASEVALKSDLENLSGLTVSWNDLTDKPFSATPIGREQKTLTFDGNVENVTHIEYVEGGVYFVKMSNDTPDVTDFIGCEQISVYPNDNNRTSSLVVTEEIIADPNYYTDLNDLGMLASGAGYGFGGSLYVFTEDSVIPANAEAGTLEAVLSAGVWTLVLPFGYFSQVQYYATLEDIKHLDEKYIPDTIARKSDLENLSGLTVSWNDLANKPFGSIISEAGLVTLSYDGDVTGKEHVQYTYFDYIYRYVKLTDRCPESDAFVGQSIGLSNGSRIDITSNSIISFESMSNVTSNEGYIIDKQSYVVVVKEDNTIMTTTNDVELSLSRGVWVIDAPELVSVSSVSYYSDGGEEIIQLDSKFIDLSTAELITVADIDAICGTTIQQASEVTF